MTSGKWMFRLISALMVLVSFFTALFQTGLPSRTGMPDTKPGEYGQWVDPFIGTGGLPWACAMLSPGPTSPFGMVRLNADTTFPGGINAFKTGNAGYYYAHNYIWGFSHTRLSGTGVMDMGHFRVTPAAGDTNPADRLSKPLVYSHKQEVATAGYYAVMLPGIDCLAELTTTVHTGAHRYTFSTGKDAHLLIDATSFLAGGRAQDGKINIIPEAMEVEGEARVFTGFTGRYGGLKGYFVARFNKPFKSFGTWTGETAAPGSTQSAGSDTGADINFGNIKNEPVELKLGISFVSLENARENLDTETAGLDFEGVRDAARAAWDTWLSRIKIESPDPEIKTIFYTALYHSMIMPTNFTDVNGQYLGFKEQVSTVGDFTYRTDMSIWDTYRTEHPLLNLIAPDIQRDCLKSLVRMARADGTLPRWPSGTGETGSMFGTPANMVVAESYLKGITDFEAEEAYGYMKNTSLQILAEGTRAQSDVQAFKDYGYVPADNEDISVSKTLELAWADGSTALLAAALGKTQDAAFFTEKSLGYKNLWNPETKYFQGRYIDGTWVTPLLPNFTSYYDEILPKEVSSAYCEGSARQWRWSAPQDPQGLVALFGREYFVSELNQFMVDASKNRAALNPGAGYWQGNQHDIHAPYLFDEAGRPDLTQKWVRWCLAERHSTDINGLDGNDDGGTLSAWYVFSAMGLYPVAGTDRYWLGSPNVEKAEINLGTGKTLTVKAENQSPENIYVQSVTLNGVRLTEPSIVHSQIADGGTMTFVMGPAPAANGGF
ncbi:MAG TPA: GH92 family glycosyl hydrolase [Clostridiales bacterium]|nr:MAG: Glycosyl hydrolase family 92 [Firmicutes bacterium ADurb.Bin262]HOU10990.1 GH92 family glycosyl hydrolase [Clostridiales bacterium]HQK73553.1 GH92 family glycosyl hydrolase [Clostridiales bacterium]